MKTIKLISLIPLLLPTITCQLISQTWTVDQWTAGTVNAVVVQPVAAPSAPDFSKEISVSANYAASSANTTTFTVSENVSVGTRLVVAVTMGAGGGGAISVADEQSNTWTTHVVSRDDWNAVAIASAHISTALSSGDDITITWDSTTYVGKNWVVIALSDCASSGQPDVTANNAAYATSVSLAGTTVASDTVAIGILYIDNSSLTYGSGNWTSVGSYRDNTQNSRRSIVVRSTFDSAGSKNPGGSWSGTGGQYNAWVAFK